MSNYSIVRSQFGHVAVFRLDADELRGIASALGSHDTGAQEMLRAAFLIDERDAEDGL